MRIPQISVLEDLPGVNDFYYTNCPSSVVGKINNGLAFNINELKAYDDSSLKFSSTESFTVELWIKTNQNGNGEKKIIGKSLTLSYDIWWIGFDANNGNPIFFSADRKGISGRCSVSDVMINDGNWHHIVAVRENLNQVSPQATGKIELYIDGIPKQFTYLYGTLGSFESYEPLYIGQLNNTDHFEGIVDEIAIYKTALDDSIIQNHYNRSLLGIRYFDDNVNNIVKENNYVTDKFEYFQNYPNPFNPITIIKFSLPHNSRVRLDVFNIIGEHIVTPVNKDMEAGFHNIPFNAINLSSGTYIYRIQAKDFTQTKRCCL